MNFFKRTTLKRQLLVSNANASFQALGSLHLYFLLCLFLNMLAYSSDSKFVFNLGAGTNFQSFESNGKQLHGFGPTFTARVGVAVEKYTITFEWTVNDSYYRVIMNDTNVIGGGQIIKNIELTTLPAGLVTSYFFPYDFYLGGIIGFSSALLHDQDNFNESSFNETLGFGFRIGKEFKFNLSEDVSNHFGFDVNLYHHGIWLWHNINVWSINFVISYGRTDL